jgi:hypothetical protein
MRVDVATSVIADSRGPTMRIPVQAGPVLRRRCHLPGGSAHGVLPSVDPCYRGNSCDLEDFLGLVDSCNQCLALGGHSLGQVGDCAMCSGPLPSPRRRTQKSAAPMLYMWNDGFCTDYRGRCPSLEVCCGLGAVSVSPDAGGQICDVC